MPINRNVEDCLKRTKVEILRTIKDHVALALPTKEQRLKIVPLIRKIFRGLRSFNAPGPPDLQTQS